MDENQNQNENLNEKEKAKEAILSESKISEDKKKAKSIKTKFKTQAKGKAKKQAKGLKQKLLVGASVLATAIVLVIALVGSYNQIQPQRMGEIARSMQYPQVNPGEEDVAETGGNVEFDAFFLRDLTGDGIAESIRGTCRNVKETDTLYMELKVQTNGRLEDGVITINGENFALQASLPQDQIISENTIGNNIKTIKLNTVNNGSQKLISGIIKSAITNNDTSKYSKKGTVKLTGTYIPDGQEEGIQITKEVQFDVDWHGYVEAQITNTNQKGDIETAIDEENDELKLNFTVYTRETKEELILKKSLVEGTIPLFNEQPPIRVECTNSNVKFNYEPNTRKFTIERESTLNEDTKIVTDTISRNNNYTIKVVYPLEAYRTAGIETIELRIPVKAYYEGHNNTNSEFNNPEVSPKQQSTIVLTYEKPQPPTGYIYTSAFDIKVGKHVYDPTSRYIISKEKPLKIYNGLSSEEKDDNYLVTWHGYAGTKYGNLKMVMKERRNDEDQVCDQFITTNGDDVSMEEVTTNIGIYFSNPLSLLGETGEIKVYDDELDELLMTFTKDNWSKYNSSTPYYYEKPVKHIRIETTTVNKETSLYVYNIKQLDDEYITEHYDLDTFMDLEHIKSTLCGYIGEELVKVDTANARYEAPYTIASINLNKTSISTQVTEKNMNITIRATANESYNQVKWQNGVFLVKLPEDIADISINNISISNNSLGEEVKIISYEKYKEGNNYYIKINTENNTPNTFNVVINCDITPNPTATTQTEQVELYYYNANAVDYWSEYKVEDSYDLDGDLNKTESIGKAKTNLGLLSPSSLLTSETITEYDNKKSITVAPQIALVEKNQGTATINIQMTNNYERTISEIKILGRVPHIGNKYAINGGDLGSEYDLKMQGEITLPPELQNIAKVYYSENGQATKDLNGDGNDWKEHPTDFTNIKSYLIDLGDNKIGKNANYNISYKVLVPKDVDYNKVSYSHHAVYFSLDTEQGKYRTQTEPNKVGIMIAKQYDLELTKYQLGRNNTVQGATYLIKEENAEEGRTKATDTNGSLTLTDFYVDKTYVIKEIKSPTNYELNEAEIKFKVTEDGEILKLVDEVTVNGNSKSIKLVEPQDNGRYKVQVQVEDEVKASLKIVKTQKESQETKLNGVRFKLTGKNFENGRSITTNKTGEVSLTGLSIGEQYTLEEIKAKEGYYLASKITFTIKNNDGKYTVEKAEENGQNLVTKAQVQETENIPILTLNIANEKIPEYTLKINKVVKGEDTPLEGAKFRLFKGTKKINDYITDTNGSITISNLYQYEETKNLDQTYTLKELLAPDGYAQVKDITFYVTNIDGVLTMKINEGKIKEQTAEDNTVTIKIEDSPSFKLIKKDGETKAPLPGTKFAIYNVDNGEEQLALDSKYNILGEKEVINGKTYYTLTTNDKGEIEANLREGLYKAVEIQTKDEKYEITNNVYYFGIGASREAEEIMATEWASSFGGSYNDEMTSISATSDGGYIVGGYWTGKKGDTITIGNYTFTNNSIGSYTSDGLLIKYSDYGDIEWASSFGGSYDDKITSISPTSDGGYIVGGSFRSSSIKVGDYTLNNNDNYGNNDGLLIKYDSNNKVEWASSFGGSYDDAISFGGSYDDEITSISATSDGGYIVGGYFFSTSITVGNLKIEGNHSGGSNSDGLLIKYKPNEDVGSKDKYVVEWATSIGGDLNDCISSVAQTSDGGYIVGGYFFSTSITVGNLKIEGNHSGGSNSDGLLIKYKPNEDVGSKDKYVVEWATSIGGSGSDYVNAVSATSDGGYIVGGRFYSSSITVGENKLTTKGNYDGLLIKYDSNNKVEWATSIGGRGSDYVNAVSATSDGGYIIGGQFGSSNITLGDYELKSNGGADGLLIKYKPNEDVSSNDKYVIEWATSFGGSNDDEITSISVSNDGGYIIGGQFRSSNITLGDYELKNNGSTNYYDELLIKYNKKELANPTVISARSFGGSTNDSINSISPTSDGGYIIGGYWSGEKEDAITIGDYELKSNGDADGLLIKYKPNEDVSSNDKYEVEWATSVGESGADIITSVSETSDGGYIVGGYWTGKKGDTITIGNYTFTNNSTYTGTYIGSYTSDGLLIKYKPNEDVSSNDKYVIEWATSFGGSGSDYVNAVSATSDGGYIVGGCFSDYSITVGSYTLNNRSRSLFYGDGLLIKYKPNEDVSSNDKYVIEWATSFGGDLNDCISSVAQTSDGGYIVGGYFFSTSITVGNLKIEGNHSGGSNSDGLLIKYKPNEDVGSKDKYVVEWATSFGGEYWRG